MERITFDIIEPLRVELPEYKDGKTKRRERRKQERKSGK